MDTLNIVVIILIISAGGLALVVLYNLNNINFCYDLGVYDIRGGDKPKNNLIEASVDDTGKVMLKMDSYHYELIDKYDENINNLIYLLDIKKDDIVDVIKGIEFFDLTFVLKSCECLRTRKPQFKKMIPILKEMNIRNVCFTAQSDLEKFDFESRVFCPHDDLNEDKVCGSSNLTITKYWNNKIHKNEFQILFPYRMMSEEKLIGGVQYTKIMNDIIYIGGYCSNYQNLRMRKIDFLNSILKDKIDVGDAKTSKIKRSVLRKIFDK